MIWIKKVLKRKYYRLLEELQLTSMRSTDVALPGRKVTELLLLIDNDDNPPLHVQEISARRVRRYYAAWLQAGKRYKLNIGNAALRLPSYDLKFFQDSIPASTSILKPGVLAIYKEKAPVVSSPVFFSRQSIVWLALGVIVVLLSFMSVRLIRDMRR